MKLTFLTEAFEGENQCCVSNIYAYTNKYDEFRRNKVTSSRFVVDGVFRGTKYTRIISSHEFDVLRNLITSLPSSNYKYVKYPVGAPDLPDLKNYAAYVKYSVHISEEDLAREDNEHMSVEDLTPIVLRIVNFICDGGLWVGRNTANGIEYTDTFKRTNLKKDDIKKMLKEIADKIGYLDGSNELIITASDRELKNIARDIVVAVGNYPMRCPTVPDLQQYCVGYQDFALYPAEEGSKDNKTGRLLSKICQALTDKVSTRLYHNRGREKGFYASPIKRNIGGVEGTIFDINMQIYKEMKRILLNK